MSTVATAVAPIRLQGEAFDRALEDLFTGSTGLDQAFDQQASEPVHDLHVIAQAAVDPLEIAAALEATGVPNRLIVGTFGHRDVFDLAQHVERPAEPVAVDVPRSGGLADLKRGAMFAVPGLAFTDVLGVGGVSLAWWCLPLALTLGWAVGQLVASVGYTLAASDERLSTGARLGVLTLFPAIAAASTVAIGIQGGPVRSAGVVVVAAFVTYMTAAAILLVDGRERALGWSLIPAGCAAVIALWGSWLPRRATLTIGAESITVIVVVVAALYRSPRVGRGTRRLHLRDLTGAVQHFLHGAACGLLVSIVLTLALVSGEPTPVGDATSASIVSWPLLLSLGVMEWHHRTLEATLCRLKSALGDLDRYMRSAHRAFLRAVACYSAVLFGLSSGVGVVALVEGGHLPAGQLSVQIGLGILLCVDLIAVNYAGVGRTLVTWCGSAVVGGIGLLWIMSSPHSGDLANIRLVAFVWCLVLAVTLTLMARRALVNPLRTT